MTGLFNLASCPQASSTLWHMSGFLFPAEINIWMVDSVRETIISMAVSFQCMTKSTTIYIKKKGVSIIQSIEGLNTAKGRERRLLFLSSCLIVWVVTVHVFFSFPWTGNLHHWLLWFSCPWIYWIIPRAFICLWLADSRSWDLITSITTWANSS